MTHVAEIALFTDDVVAVGGFYRDVAGAPPVAECPGGALFDLGRSKILVHERSAALADGPPNEDHFALAVDDLDASCDALRAGGLSCSPGRRTTAGDAPRTSAIPTAGSWSWRRPD